jgi:aminoglycoside phosphotransferase (APT) family kinase protein
VKLSVSAPTTRARTKEREESLSWSTEVRADFLRQEVMTRPAPPLSLAPGDFLPKNLLIHDGAIVGVIDWEFAGPAAPAFDLARREVSAGDALHDRSDLLCRGYARVANPESAAAGLTPAFAIDWTLEKLGWNNPLHRRSFGAAWT